MTAQIIDFPSDRVKPWDYVFDYDEPAPVIDIDRKEQAWP